MTSGQAIRNGCAHPGRYVRDGVRVVADDVVLIYNILDEAIGLLGEVLERSPNPPIGSS